MERGDRKALGGAAQNARESFAERGRRGGGESNREYACRWNATRLDQIADSPGEHRRLAAAGASEDAERTLTRLNNLALARGEEAEVHTGGD